MPKYQTVTGRFVFGMKIGETVHKDFELRESFVEDMVEAEKEADAQSIHTFNVAQLARLLVRVGDFTGPFTPGMIAKLKKADYNRLVQSMLEADALGEAVSGDSADS